MELSPALPRNHPLLNLLKAPEFSGIISIVHEGRKLLTFTSGFSNRGKGRAIDRDTPFPTASLSKMFTAICVARMMENGLCGFEQPIGEIVPILEPHFAPDVTLGSLLSHRSGLGDYIDDEAALPFAGIDLSRLDRLEDFLPLVVDLARHKSKEFRYSSAGYVLIGLAIERITGLRFPEAINRWVTLPAGMVSIGFPRIDEEAEDLATGYLDDGSSNIGHLPLKGGPDGGIVTNIADLLIFFDRLRDGSLVSLQTLDFLLQPTSTINERLSYGRGFYISKVHGQTWYGHTGSDPGLSARVAFSRQSNSSIVVLCNIDGAAFPVFKSALDRISDKIHPDTSN